MLKQSDYHIHAAYYRLKKPGDPAGPTAAEQVAAARAVGSRSVGIVEHCNAAAKHPFHCLEELSAEYYSAGFDRTDVFLGVEADLDAEGGDWCGAAGREKLRLHYVIGSVHLAPRQIPDVTEYIREEHCRIVGALRRNANIDFIGHPFGEGFHWEKDGLIPKWEWRLIPEEFLSEVIRCAADSGKALEVNRCNMSDPVYRDFLLQGRAAGVKFSVGSDAHNTSVVGLAAERTRWLESLGFTEDDHWRPKR